MFVNFNILNQLGSPAINSNTFANRPAAGQTGRLFVSTDTYEIYRDNGTTWDLIGGPGSSTITGTGTATQVAYFTSSQAIGSSANLYWDNTAGALGINTATPGAELDVHGTGTIAQFNTTSATGNTYIAFQRTGTGLWRIGDTYNAGNNFFELHNTVLGTDALEFEAATNKSAFQAQQTYTTGLARGNYFDYNLSVAAGGSFSSPNSITALGASLDLTLAGNATIPSGARSGLDAYNSIRFTGAGTLTHNQGAQIRAYSNLTAGWAFNGTAIGTITHLAGLRALFPDNSGSAVNVTNNYALLLNDQTPNTGTVTYTNRWGVYQEGATDLNYMAANLLLGSTTNSGEKLQVTGTSYLNGNVGVGTSPTTRTLAVKSSTDTYISVLGGATDDVGYLFGEAGNDATGRIIYNNSGDNMQFWTNSSERMRVLSTGQVIVGATNSNLTRNFSVIGNTGVSIQNDNNSGTYFDIVANGAGSTVDLKAYQLTGANPPMTFYTGNAERMRLDSNGNLLIGTTTSSFLAERLQVSGDINTYNSVGGGVFTYAGSKQANLNAGGIGLYMEDYTISGIDYHQVKFNSNTFGDPVIFLSTVKTDGTSTNIQLGDIIVGGNGTVIVIDDANQVITFNSGIGKYQFGNVPQFANNAAAIAAGYPAGYIYRITGTGDLKIVI